MKNKRLRKVLLTTGLVAVSFGMFLGHLSIGKIGEAVHESYASPIEDYEDWYSLIADDTEDVYALDLKLSPLPDDYRGISKDSIKTFVHDLFEGAKNIAAAQFKFVQPVEEPERKAENWDLKPDEPIRKDVLDALIEGVLGDGEGGANVDNVEDYNSTLVVKEQGLDGTAGLFLREMMAYVASFGQDGSTDKNLISTRLGVDVDDQGNVTPTAQSSVYQTFLEIYEATGDPQAEDKALLGLQKTYEDANEIADNPVVKTESLVKIFDALEETTVPVKTVVEIIGAQNTLDGVKSIFTDKEVGIQYGIHFLNELSTRTIADICDTIQSDLYDPATDTGGFTKQDILDAFEEATNERLLEIFDGLNSNGLQNIRVVLGKPVDYDEGGFIPIDPSQYRAPVRAKRAPTLTSGGAASSSDYARFGTELMEIVMERLSISDIITATKSIEVVYKDVHYIIAEKPDVNGTTGNLQLRLHNIVDLLNALPKMEEIRTTADGEMVLDFTVNLITVFNDKIVTTDETTGDVISEEYAPVIYNCSVGFQNKDSKYIRKLAALLDDTFDLTFDFDDNQDFSIDLVTRSPNFVTNFYAWLCDSGFIKNDNVDKFLNEIWDIAFSPISEIRDYIQGKEIEDVVRNLNELDYEKAFELITTADELNEIFSAFEITDARIERVINLFARLLNKASTVTYDSIVEFVNEVVPEVGDKLESATLEKIYNKLLSIVKKVADKDISVEMLKGITNEGISRYIEKLTGKEDLFVKVRDLIVKVLDALPESLKSKSIMDAYEGDGRFVGSHTFDLDWEKTIKKIPSYGSKLWVAFNNLIVGNDRPETLSLSIDAQFNDVYSITYEWTEDGQEVSKTGMLHEGSDVKLFSGIEEDDNGTIVHWIDKNEDDITRVDEMVDYDVVVVPEYLFDVEITDAIDKVYDGTGSLTVTTSSDLDEKYTYTYQWQKLGEDGETWEDVTGETEATISVPNVLDSGTYRCVVNNGDVDVESAARDVEITKAEIDITTAEWNKEGVVNYTGENITVEIKEETIPEGAHVDSYTGDYVAKDKGEYSATAIFALDDPDNYCFANDVSTLDVDWEIKESVYDDFEATWLELDEFEFDGTEKYPEIDPESYPSDEITVTYETKLVTAEGNEYVSGGQTAVGEYVAKAIFTPNDPNCSIAEECLPDTKTFTIFKTVDLSDLKWSHHDTFGFDGESHKVCIQNAEEIPEIASITYETTLEGGDSTDTNSARDIGSYTTVATINRQEGYNENTIRFINDNVSGEDNAKEWSIKTALIKVTSVDWDYENPFTYEPGVERTVSLVAASLPDHVTFEYVTDDGEVYKATDAGEYVAKVKLVIDSSDPDAANYGFTDDSITEYTLNWKINPKVISLEDVTWGTSETYTGEEQTIEITSATNLEYADITYEGNKATNAGSYLVTATITSKDSNYVFADPTLAHAYDINKKNISVGTITWGEDQVVTYDGSEHTLEVTGYENDDLIDIAYVTAKGGTNAGDYVVKVIFTLKDEAKANYNLVGTTSASATLTINPVEISSSDLVTWSEDDTFTYDGNKHSVIATINADYVDIVDFGYIHNALKTHEATNAGEYTAQIVCQVNQDNAGNYIIVDDEAFSYDWSIEKAVVKIEDLTWSSDEGFVYDGESHSITLSYNVSGAPTDVVQAIISDASKVNAGTYTATVNFELLDTDNYEFFADYHDEQEWSIAKSVVKIENISWSSDEGFVYDGESHSINVTYNIVGAPEDVISVTVSDASKVDANTYLATVEFELLDTDNYELSAYNDNEHEWTISKAIINVDSFEWSYDGTAYIYDGLTHNVNILNELPEQVEVTYTGDNDEVNAGSYSTTATLSIKAEYLNNYEFAEGATLESTVDWEIAKKHVSPGTIIYSDSEFVYDNTDKTVSIVSYENSNVIDASITDNVKKNAGDYTATVTFTLKNGFADNYILDVEQATKDYSIAKKQVVISSATWSNGELTYTGSEQSITLTCNDASLINIAYTNNKATNAGYYTAVATITLKDSDNYELVGVNSISQNWVINKKQVTISGVAWSDASSTLIYDGETKTVAIVAFTNSELVDVTYTGNTATNAGNYTAIALFTLKDSNNYVLTNDVASHNFSIAKAQISVSNVVWDYSSPFVTDGSIKEVKVTSYTNSNYVDVHTSGNIATAPGSYVANANFEIKPQYAMNYELVNTPTSSLNWRILNTEAIIYYDFTSLNNKDNDNNYYVIIHIDEGIEVNPDLIAKLTNGKEFDGANIDFKELIGSNGEIKYSYDISFEKDGLKYNPGEKTYTIKVLIPEELRDQDYSVVALESNNSVSLVETEISADGKYLVIHDTSIKNIGFVTEVQHSTSLMSNPHFIVLIFILAASQLVLVKATVSVSKKIKKNNEKNS